MKRLQHYALGLLTALAASHAGAAITLYEHDDFQGEAVSLLERSADFRDVGFNDRVSSIVVRGETWEVCRDIAFRNGCVVLKPGRYRSLSQMQVNDMLSSARPVQGARDGRNGREGREGRGDRRGDGDIVFYPHTGFRGAGFSTSRDVSNLTRAGLNDQASSVVVFDGRWEVCEHVNFGGRCMVLRPGRYPDLASMGLNDTLSSVRQLGGGGGGRRGEPDRPYAPAPAPVYDWRERHGEVLYTVNVDSVRAVYATRQERCWVDREPVARPAEGNLPGALIGGVLGGILGHQVGGGSGRDIATVGGAVAGAVIGSQVGRDGSGAADRPVQRCTSAPAQQQQPDYWDVGYQFRGTEHHVQMTSPPGPTLRVNKDGEPRI
jgi:uncharacterized protein YcfJ